MYANCFFLKTVKDKKVCRITVKNKLFIKQLILKIIKGITEITKRG